MHEKKCRMVLITYYIKVLKRFFHFVLSIVEEKLEGKNTWKFQVFLTCEIKKTWKFQVGIFFLILKIAKIRGGSTINAR